MLASHLQADDLVDVTLYLRYQCLLMPSDEPRFGQLIVWQEIFPTRRFKSASNVSPVPGYKETGTRWFLMAIALVANCGVIANLITNHLLALTD